MMASPPAVSGEVYVDQSGGAASSVQLSGSAYGGDDIRGIKQSQASGHSIHPSVIAVRRGNVARSVVFGNNNLVGQAQFGKNNESNVGIFRGESNMVGVLQAGNGLQSNVGLINTRGLGVVVLQGPNSQPQNVLAIGLKNGGLMIAR